MVTINTSYIDNQKIINKLDKYKEVNPDFNNTIQLQFDMPTLYYPYSPPNITIIEPKFDNVFLYTLFSLDYFKQDYWNPSNTLEYTIFAIKNIINQYGELDLVTNPKFNINNNIIKLWSLLNIQLNTPGIQIDFIKITSNNTIIKTNIASGTGYSNNSSSQWDIKKFINENKNKSKDIIENLEYINTILLNNINEITEDFIQTKLSAILAYYLNNVNILEITNKLDEYKIIINIIKQIIKFSNNILTTFISELIITVEEYLEIIKNSNEDLELIQLCELILKFKELDNQKTIQNSISPSNIFDIKSYSELKDYQFKQITISNFSIKDKITSNINTSRKILREFSSLNKSLPFNYESSIFFKYDDHCMNKIKFMIIGPKDTPYQDGCYIFDMLLPSNYPDSCPKVNFLTTGYGSVRFNPNLYNCGKVCLSLLGTWTGESWNEQSTILQVLVSIQSLILVEHPYFNEPGHQSSYGTIIGMKQSVIYNNVVHKNNIKWAIINNILNPPREFADIINKHFAIKKNDILGMVEKLSLNNDSIYSQLDDLKDALNKYV